MAARILIADPYPEIADLLAYVVTGMGHEPCTPAAVDVSSYASIDVVILEPGHPGMLTLASAVRRARPTAQVVCVSIYPSSDEIGDLDPVGYLAKPFSIARLQSLIRRAVSRSQTDAADAAVASL